MSASQSPDHDINGSLSGAPQPGRQKRQWETPSVIVEALPDGTYGKQAHPSETNIGCVGNCVGPVS